MGCFINIYYKLRDNFYHNVLPNSHIYTFFLLDISLDKFLNFLEVVYCNLYCNTCTKCRAFLHLFFDTTK